MWIVRPDHMDALAYIWTTQSNWNDGHLLCVCVCCGSQVMWVRRTVDKFSLLSVGNVTHTGDPRFKVTFQYPNNWRLHINPMQKDDSGLYMCQVSTHPPRVFTTNVTVMREYKSFLPFACYFEKERRKKPAAALCRLKLFLLFFCFHFEYITLDIL